MKGERCEACGTDSNLQAHHVNGDPMDNTPSNVQTLCQHCHAFWHSALRRAGLLPKEPMPPLFLFSPTGCTGG